MNNQPSFLLNRATFRKSVVPYGSCRRNLKRGCLSAMNGSLPRSLTSALADSA